MFHLRIINQDINIIFMHYTIFYNRFCIVDLHLLLFQNSFHFDIPPHQNSYIFNDYNYLTIYFTFTLLVYRITIFRVLRIWAKIKKISCFEKFLYAHHVQVLLTSY